MNALHFGDPRKSSGLSFLKYSHKRSTFACMSRSQQLRDMSKSSPGVRAIRLGVIAVLGWFKSPQSERHSDSDPAASSRGRLVTVLQTTHPADVPTMNELLRTFFDAQENTVQNLSEI